MDDKRSNEIPAEQSRKWLGLYEHMEANRVPYHAQVREVLYQLNGMRAGVSSIVERWKAEYLSSAQSHDKSNPNGQNYENYSGPIIAPTEMLRLAGFKSLAYRIYDHVVPATDEYCQKVNVDLHRGALYANYGISHLEQGHYELGISWLLAASNEDYRFNRISTSPGGYAWEIYGKWVDACILKTLQPTALSFVSSRLGISIGLPEFMEMLTSLAGVGDLNLLRGIVEYNVVRGRNDYMGHSVRFACLRDLATLFEVLLKQIGEHHNDPAVRSAFSGSPMLAHVIHFMHYPQKRKKGLCESVRQWLIAPPPTFSSGLFWNALKQESEVLAGIKSGFKYIKNFKKHSIADVFNYLQATQFLDQKYSGDEEIAKRFLLAYRLRNETSHSFHPEDPGIVAHADALHLWLLQAIFYAYFWFTTTGQATL